MLAIIIALWLACGETLASDAEKRLQADLLAGYNVNVRPNANDSAPVNVSIGMGIQRVIDIDEKNQIMTVNAWLVTPVLHRSECSYQIAQIIVHSKELPRPGQGQLLPACEITVYRGGTWQKLTRKYSFSQRSADENIGWIYPSNVVISSDGSVVWVPPGIFKGTCKIDARWFPFDAQTCPLKFGSWTHSGSQLALHKGDADISTYIENAKWRLMDFCYQETAGKNSAWVTALFNQVISLAGVAAFVAVFVLLLMVPEAIPQTSESFPFIGAYLACVMILASTSMAFTVMNFGNYRRTAVIHHRPIAKNEKELMRNDLGNR